MVFSYPVDCLLTFVVASVALQKILNTIQSHVDVASCAIRVQLRTFFPMLQREVLSWWFIVATSVFNAVIHLNWFVHILGDMDQIKSPCRWKSTLTVPFIEKAVLIFSACFGLLFPLWSVHIHVGLYLAPLFCQSICLCVYAVISLSLCLCSIIKFHCCPA